MDIHKIILPTPFAVGNVNIFLIQGERLTLVDAGVKTEEAWQAFQQQINGLGFTVSDIEQIVLTHHHPDHVGLLDYFESDIPVIGHPRNDVWISRDEAFIRHHDAFFAELFPKAGIDEKYMGALAGLKSMLRYSCERSLTHAVKEGDSIPGLSGWEVIETPGHALDHIALYHPQEKVMIGGDLLLEKVSSNPVLEPPQTAGGEREKSLLHYNHSLERLRQFDIDILYTGHGNEIHNVNELVEERLKKQRDRAAKVLHLLREKPSTVFMICQQLFPEIYKKQLSLTMSETLGQLDYLESVGAVTVDSSNGYWVYYAK
ncbi:MBL fold metallo-hydrolase [Priestia koreensis]|uniref:MBL fold metallo-hydrolase n=1 Tax=Priestia koreensis TaxID=284581 RepID=UPI003015BE96